MASHSEEVEKQFRTFVNNYKTAKAFEELGKALVIMENLGRFVMQERDVFLKALHHYNSPMNEDEENVPESEQVPF